MAYCIATYCFVLNNLLPFKHYLAQQTAQPDARKGFAGQHCIILKFKINIHRLFESGKDWRERLVSARKSQSPVSSERLINLEKQSLRERL